MIYRWNRSFDIDTLILGVWREGSLLNQGKGNEDEEWKDVVGLGWIRHRVESGAVQVGVLEGVYAFVSTLTSLNNGLGGICQEKRDRVI